LAGAKGSPNQFDFLDSMPSLKKVSQNMSEAELLDILHRGMLGYTGRFQRAKQVASLSQNPFSCDFWISAGPMFCIHQIQDRINKQLKDTEPALPSRSSGGKPL
jgi:hypothetical protein